MSKNCQLSLIILCSKDPDTHTRTRAANVQKASYANRTQANRPAKRGRGSTRLSKVNYPSSFDASNWHNEISSPGQPQRIEAAGAAGA